MAPAPLRSRLISLAVALPLALGGCGEGIDVPRTPPLEQSPEISDITDPYFSNDAYIGRTVTVTVTVTVTGEVTRIITGRSFVITGQKYGDDSLLVLSAPDIDVTVGEDVTVTGVVRQFAYDAYAEDYDFNSPDPYTGFDAEEFLVATNPSSPSADPSPASGA